MYPVVNESLAGTWEKQCESHESLWWTEGATKGGRGVNGSRIKFFARIGLCPEFKSPGNLCARWWWIQFWTAEQWPQLNYETSGRRMRSIRLTVSKLRSKESSKFELKNPVWTSRPLTWTSPPEIVPDLSGPPRIVHSSFLRPNLSFPKLILELEGTKLNETWTHGSPQHKEQVSKEGFL
jgi:hypothetical protein